VAAFAEQHLRFVPRAVAAGNDCTACDTMLAAACIEGGFEFHVNAPHEIENHRVAHFGFGKLRNGRAALQCHYRHAVAQIHLRREHALNFCGVVVPAAVMQGIRAHVCRHAFDVAGLEFVLAHDFVERGHRHYAAVRRRRRLEPDLENFPPLAEIRRQYLERAIADQRA